MPERILVIEDEPQMRLILRDNLEYEGYSVVCASTGEEGLQIALTSSPQLVLLDVMLPKISGFEVCQRLRAAGGTMPILLLTARNTEIDRISGLEFGADDYICKPFSVPELLARVRAQFRRFERMTDHSIVKCGALTVDRKLRIVRRGSRDVALSSREFDLLQYFVDHRGQPVTRDELLKNVWGYSSPPRTRTVDNFVAKLRKKIEPNIDHPRYIATNHGDGYRFIG